MFQNSMKAFFYHILACIASFLMLQAFSPYEHPLSIGMYAYLFHVLLLVVVYYIKAGTKLNRLASPLHDWLSVATVAVPGLIMWFSMSFLPGEGQSDWVFFSLYYLSIRPLGEMLSIESHSVQLIFTFIVCFLPSLFMGFGLKIKRNKR